MITWKEIGLFHFCVYEFVELQNNLVLQKSTH